MGFLNARDTRGYKIYRGLKWEGEPVIFHPVDSTSGTTYHDEILLPNLSNKHPTVHHFITAHDLHHAYARNESMPSDTITIKVFSPFMVASSRLHSDENAAFYDGWKELNLKAGIYMFRIDGKIRKEVVR